MKKATLRCSLFLVLLAGTMSATTFTTLPASGLITGAPGQTVGWGFSATNDNFTQSLSFSQSVLIGETNPLLGVYNDLIGQQGGPDNYSVDLGQTWSEGFSNGSLTGLGFFTIDPHAAIGSSDSGYIRVFYNFADSTPGSIDVPFIVTVQAASVPEPGSCWMVIAGGALIVLRRVRRSMV